MNQETNFATEIQSPNGIWLYVKSISKLKVNIRATYNKTQNRIMYTFYSIRCNKRPIDCAFGEPLNNKKNEDISKIIEDFCYKEVYSIQYNEYIGKFTINYVEEWFDVIYENNEHLLSHIILQNRFPCSVLCDNKTIHTLASCGHQICIRCLTQMMKPYECATCRKIQNDIISTNIPNYSLRYTYNHNIYNIIHVLDGPPLIPCIIEADEHFLRINNIFIIDSFDLNFPNFNLSEEDVQQCDDNEELIIDGITHVSNIPVHVHIEYEEESTNNQNIVACIYMIHVKDYKIIQKIYVTTKVSTDINTINNYDHLRIKLQLLHYLQYDNKLGRFICNKTKCMAPYSLIKPWIIEENIQKLKKPKLEIESIFQSCSCCNESTTCKIPSCNHSICTSCIAKHTSTSCPLCDSEPCYTIFEEFMNLFIIQENGSNVSASLLMDGYSTFATKKYKKTNICPPSFDDFIVFLCIKYNYIRGESYIYNIALKK